MSRRRAFSGGALLISLGSGNKLCESALRLVSMTENYPNKSFGHKVKNRHNRAGHAPARLQRGCGARRDGVFDGLA
jgi:hypothetical protein